MPTNHIHYTPMQSRLATEVMRRNYRWMRRDGVNRLTARIIIESTRRSALGDEIYARAGR